MIYKTKVSGNTNEVGRLLEPVSPRALTSNGVTIEVNNSKSTVLRSHWTMKLDLGLISLLSSSNQHQVRLTAIL